MKTYLQNIRRIRKHRGYSQMYMGHEMGTDYSVYGKKERGCIKITVDELIHIAEILEVPVDLLFCQSLNISTTIEVQHKK